MRTIHVNDVTGNIREMCIEANHYLTPDMDAALKNAVETEKSGLGKQILNQLQDDTNLPGYGNGSSIYGDWTGCTL